MKILGIETSCDETAAAVVQDGKTILNNVVASSTKMHRKYGGIVPEVAARKQVEYMIPILAETMSGFSPDDIDAIAVTVGPGLIGSLLIGVETAKTLAYTWNKPIIAVNHVIAHIYANFVTSDTKQETRMIKNEHVTYHVSPITFPAICLVVSGGHTELYVMKNVRELKWLGGTLDDAAGEAFDKGARLLGFENRGGVAIQEAALRHSGEERSDDSRIDSGQARMTKVSLPRPMLHDDSLNFSFSGLKTALLRDVNKLKQSQQFNNTATRLPARQIQQLSFELQEAITDVLVTKTLTAAKQHNAKSILLSGGVSANTRLREKFNSKLTTHNTQIFAPQRELCTDNAAAIAACAFYQNKSIPWQNLNAEPNLSIERNNRQNLTQ
ncbi:tRNA (adenosine(37)-N6)-threonylcarbamoyltransferase complex transferase subunit TsaD [Candidatus Microgenomates bacterium]|nr:MAG: tRNA (adenosine(37)-N6)-threonylcarbamoyltransferase complex transferase subunit TsaD [Candidatus Microgenomates bacterium]